MDAGLLLPTRHGLDKGKILVVEKDGGRITDDRFSLQARIGQGARLFALRLVRQHRMNLSETTRAISMKQASVLFLLSGFAYVGNPSQPATWKLLYCLSDDGIDEKRLAKAIQAILSNYCRVKVSCIPAQNILAVLRRLAPGSRVLARWLISESILPRSTDNWLTYSNSFDSGVTMTHETDY